MRGGESVTMDIHRPKPVHGWREFLGEIGVIVIGISIALTGEQLVEAWHWHSEINEVKEALNSDAKDHFAQAEELVAIGPCEAIQLRKLDDIVRRPGPLPPHLPDLTMALRSWSTNGWSIASASGTLPHMSSEDRNDYSKNAEVVRLIEDYNGKEFLTLGDIKTLRPSTVLSDVTRDRILSDIARAQQMNTVLQVAAKELLHTPIRSSPQHLSAGEQAVIDKERLACTAKANL